jgi:hypothetical protein
MCACACLCAFGGVAVCGAYVGVAVLAGSAGEALASFNLQGVRMCSFVGLVGVAVCAARVGLLARC